jgi:integrase
MPGRKRGINRLTDRECRTIGKGQHHDGNGLYLIVRASATADPNLPMNRSWKFRWGTDGKNTMGLGRFPDIGLAEARRKVSEFATQIAQGLDPREVRSAERLKASLPKSKTFREHAEAYIENAKAGWKNAKHQQQWQNTLRDYAFPKIGDKQITAITKADLLSVLGPIWTRLPETADRLFARLHRVIDYGIVKEDLSCPNILDNRHRFLQDLPRRPKKPVRHHPNLAYQKLPDFMVMLQTGEHTTHIAFQLLILTAARTGETIYARVSEFNLKDKNWKIPGERTKNGKKHEVPLSDYTVSLVKRQLELRQARGHEASPFLFPNPDKPEKPLSNNALLALLKRKQLKGFTPHGMRATFKEWASENTDHETLTIEYALNHTPKDKLESAYYRLSRYELRTNLMNAWSDYATQKIVNPQPTDTDSKAN